MTITQFQTSVTLNFGDPYETIIPTGPGGTIYITAVVIRDATNAAGFEWAFALTPSDFDPAQVLLGNNTQVIPAPTGSDYQYYSPNLVGFKISAQSVAIGDPIYLNWVSGGQTPSDSVVFDVFGYVVS